MHLLLTGAWAGAKDNLERLTGMGHEVIFLQQEKDPLPCEPDWVHGVVCNGLFQHHPIEQFANLRFIQLTSAGTDRVPMDYVRQHGIELHNAAGVYSVPMAEFALAGVLQLYKQSRFFVKNQEEHRWEKHRGLLELAGKTVCIVGCGSVGSECAKRFQAFGCRVVGVNRTVPEIFPGSAVNERQELPAVCKQAGSASADAAARSADGDADTDRWRNFDRIVGLDHLDEVLAKADIVLLSIALTEQTSHLIDAGRLAKMKSGAILVNVARGAIVDQEALIRSLMQTDLVSDDPGSTELTGKTHSPALWGAVLDVFEDEPLDPASPLWDMEHVILTPHNSFVGDGNRGRLDGVIVGNIG